jgi:hypothetical protein
VHSKLVRVQVTKSYCGGGGEGCIDSSKLNLGTLHGGDWAASQNGGFIPGKKAAYTKLNSRSAGPQS